MLRITSKLNSLFSTPKLYFKFLSTMENPVISVSEGKIKGAVNRLLDGTPYYSFRGVRYAQAPIGKLRYKAPLPAKAFDGIFDATQDGPICPQADMFTLQILDGDEDCLRLNIYTKTLDSNSKVPVMVFIHGGAYMSGSARSDESGPEILLQHDVILVTINYRLEVLGFLSLETPEVPGNAGMKDQVAALRWVQRNIAKFGGDPDNVTIFGESAGSSSVTYHMLSPMSKGLFHKAIAQSGVCLQDWAITHNAKERAFRVGKVLGKETNDVNELLDFLQSVPASSLSKMTFKTRSTDDKHRSLPMYFVPVVENKFDNCEAFITEEPIDMIVKNKMHPVPLILGYTSAEGILMVENQLKKADFLNKNPSYFVPRDIAEKVSQEKLREFGERIKNFYYNGKDFTENSKNSIIQMQTDTHFLYNTHRFAEFYSKMETPIYFYRFDYNTELNLLKYYLNMTDVEGACHADDLFYIFYSGLNKDVYNGNENLRKIAFKVTKLWADFATTGNPTPDNKWPRYTKAGKEYFNINESWSPGKFAEKERTEFWNKLYSDAGLPYIASSHL